MQIKLTQYSKGAGCGCKLSSADLHEILKDSYSEHFPNLIVGNTTNDDAAVMDIGNDQYLISTTDFFTPIVDDAGDFGRIAAANAISDVYAMGGKPILAIAILGWPIGKIPHAVATQVINGAKEVCAQAGIPLAGGHSIDSPEPFFGLSVNGIVSKARLKTNQAAQAGDLIYITKPIGSGVLSTAQKRGKLDDNYYSELKKNLLHLNREGELFSAMPYVHAMTDITGFGISGHLLELCKAAELSAELVNEKIPLMEGVKEIVAQFIYPDNTMRNYQAVLPLTEGLNASNMFTLCDPQTNGGIMVSVDPAEEKSFEDFCRNEKISIFKIGRFIQGPTKLIIH